MRRADDAEEAPTGVDVSAPLPEQEFAIDYLLQPVDGSGDTSERMHYVYNAVFKNGSVTCGS